MSTELTISPTTEQQPAPLFTPTPYGAFSSPTWDATVTDGEGYLASAGHGPKPNGRRVGWDPSLLDRRG